MWPANVSWETGEPIFYEAILKKKEEEPRRNRITKNITVAITIVQLAVIALAIICI